jgi:zinc/manganese transport system substrate-binding protein
MRRRRVVLALAVLAVLGGLYALLGHQLRPQPAPSPTRPPPIDVVASTNVYSAIAAAVGGERIRALPLIVDANAQPEAYEAGPGDTAAVASAKVVVFNGGGYDDFMTQLLDAAGDRPVRVNVTELSGLAPADGGLFNEHVWYSLSTMRTLATRLASEFSTLDYAGAGEYAANATAFATKIDQLITRTNAIGAKHPGTQVVVTDPTPGYLIEAAGLVDVTPDQFTANADGPSDAVINQTTALFRTGSVRALVVNSQDENPAATRVEQAATAANVPIVRMTETIPADTADYATWMGRQIDDLGAALDRPH